MSEVRLLVDDSPLPPTPSPQERARRSIDAYDVAVAAGAWDVAATEAAHVAVALEEIDHPAAADWWIRSREAATKCARCSEGGAVLCPSCKTVWCAVHAGEACGDCGQRWRAA